MRNEFLKSGFLTNAQQIGRMAATYPRFRRYSQHGRLRWVGEITPTPLSETYTVEITYALRGRPRVRVLKPPLEPLEPGGKIPHTFSDGSVCLHVPTDWSPQRFIADFVVPWISIWLFYYEIWRGTGEWLGGGHEPGKRNQ